MYSIAKFGDLYDITSSKRVFEADWKTEGVPFYRAREIVKLAQNGYVDNELFISNEMYDEYSKKYGIPKEGDIMVTGVGTLGICYVTKANDKFYFKDGNIIWFKDKGLGINPRFIEYGFKSNFVRQQIDNNAGSVVGTYTIQKAKETKIPLPPLSTQSCIVARLDSAFASIDEQISLLRANIADVENMRKSVLEESLISEDFETKKINDISIVIQYGYTGKTKETGKYKLLRITDIQNNSIDWNTVPFVDITYLEAQKYMLNVGDIVFARTGATVGKSCTINYEGVGQVFASYLIRVVVKPGILTSEFLQYFFYSKYYWDQIYADVVGAAQPNFNGSKLKEIQIPLPPLPRQHEIVAHLDQVFAETASLKSEYEAQIRNLQTLKQSLLEEAFVGRLLQD